MSMMFKYQLTISYLPPKLEAVMGISERRERQKAELRDTILAAARRIFAAEGAEALTMRRIAEAIEYSPGTLYLYFSSREEIAMQLVSEGFKKLLASVEPALAIDDPIERLRAIGRAYVAFGVSDPQTYKLIFMQDPKYVYSVLAPGDAADPGRSGQQAFDVMASAIRAAVACGWFKPVDPLRAAEAFWAALHGVVSLYITCPKMIPDVASTAALLEDILVAGSRA
jgi:AcrR family transcriptional regulator